MEGEKKEFIFKFKKTTTGHRGVCYDSFPITSWKKNQTTELSDPPQPGARRLHVSAAPASDLRRQNLTWGRRGGHGPPRSALEAKSGSEATFPTPGPPSCAPENTAPRWASCPDPQPHGEGFRRCLAGKLGPPERVRALRGSEDWPRRLWS